mmetsp:Transcript_24440/g.80361  ORF Transcript_24440/g.80361 Transcript_24440/m.80361 type:complete len:236 (+) Transcript_24440:462-1169(+)
MSSKKPMRARVEARGGGAARRDGLRRGPQAHAALRLPPGQRRDGAAHARPASGGPRRGELRAARAEPAHALGHAAALRPARRGAGPRPRAAGPPPADALRRRRGRERRRRRRRRARGRRAAPVAVLRRARRGGVPPAGHRVVAPAAPPTRRVGRRSGRVVQERDGGAGRAGDAALLRRARDGAPRRGVGGAPRRPRLLQVLPPAGARAEAVDRDGRPRAAPGGEGGPRRVAGPER